MQTTIATAYIRTKSDVANEWAIDDRVTQLRPWATHTIYPLPPPPLDECWIGTSSTCEIRLEDPTHRLSRYHARLVRGPAAWRICEGHTNGFKIDGSRRSDIALAPGLEISVGGVTLIAESPLLVGLRDFLARLLGMTRERAADVDRALRAVRMAAARRAALTLSGDGDLVPLAHSIHRHVRGAHRPFVICDPRRTTRAATVRVAENFPSGMAAFAHAAGGSLCVRTRRLPHDFRDVLDALRSPDSQVQLVVCADDRTDCAIYGGSPITIPPLASRTAELDTIIQAYASEAQEELRPRSTTFPAVDCAWVRKHACTSLSEIEKATRRLVALRGARNLSHAAAMLGMAPVSLSRWIGRRSLPMEFEP